ncbi:hypothetical protein JYT28_00800 [Desulfobulbus sp. AH-315-M07]|nr:hypothetical protein [Desulfobulbus sp. AH-315-M07]
MVDPLRDGAHQPLLFDDERLWQRGHVSGWQLRVGRRLQLPAPNRLSWDGLAYDVRLAPGRCSGVRALTGQADALRNAKGIASRATEWKRRALAPRDERSYNRPAAVCVYSGAHAPIGTSWDDGGGVPSAIRDHIFDPFFTTKEPGEGTGLGLPISLRIVTEHGGKLELGSSEGEGAVFRVVLPVSQRRAGT